MIPEYFIYIAATMNFLGGISYLYQTIKGKVQPNKVTWLSWAIAPLVAFAAQMSRGVGIVALMTFMNGFSPLLIFLASFVHPKAHWTIRRIDIACGLTSIMGVFLWYITDDANFAIAFGVLADFVAAIPTLIKSYTSPETEDARIFIMGSISAGITLLTIQTWDFSHVAFPAYIFAICIVFVVLIKSHIRKKGIL